MREREVPVRPDRVCPAIDVKRRRGLDDLIHRREVMKKLLAKLVKDETGGEVLEYALIAGLIVVAAIAVIGTVGTKVLARWTSLNSSL